VGSQDPVVSVRTVEWSGIGADSAWGQQVSVDPDCRGFSAGQPWGGLVLPWNPLEMDSQTMPEEVSVTVYITITAGHHFWRSRLPR
jgi:hypothetical protein